MLGRWMGRACCCVRYGIAYCAGVFEDGVGSHRATSALILVVWKRIVKS